MHIGIEAHGFWDQPEGQAKAIHCLIQGLSRIDDTNRYTLFLNSVRHRKARLEAVRRQLGNSRLDVRLFPLPNTPHPAALFLRERVVWPWAARNMGVDVFHSTSYRGVFSMGMKTVLTIHDFAYHEMPEVFPPASLAYYRRLPADAARARFVVTVSEYTKRDAIRILGLPATKIRVVYNGVDHTRFRYDMPRERVSEIRSRYGLMGRTVLAVGNMNPKKNILRLVSAFREVAKSIADVQLLLIGKNTQYGQIVRECIETSGLDSRIRFTGYVPDEDLPLLYRASDLFVFPSLFEGFGLPLLEAMACGTPIVSSNATCLPEVAGEAAVLIDPEDEQRMAEAICCVLTDNAVRMRLIEQGLKRSQTFSWGEAARQALRVYEDAIRPVG